MAKKYVSSRKAWRAAREIVEKLSPYCEVKRGTDGEPAIEVAGSLRRGRNTVGDIEIVARPKQARDLFGPADGEDQITAFLHSQKVPLEKDGPKQKAFVYRGIPVDLYLVEDRGRWGWRLLLSTGSAEFNKWIVTKQEHGGARPPDINMSGGWLERVHQGGSISRLETQEEAHVFGVFGLPWIPPQYRQDDEWIEYLDRAAVAGKSPGIDPDLLEGII